MRLGVVGDSRYDMPVRLHNNVCGCCRDPFHSCIHRSSGWVNHCYIHTNINRSAHLVSSAANALSVNLIVKPSLAVSRHGHGVEITSLGMCGFMTLEKY